MERDKFDRSWKDAFDKAEVSPSDRVWTNIELDLEKARGGALKKRLFFYQMVAAAAVTFAMVISGIGYYSNIGSPKRAQENLALQNTDDKSAEETPSKTDLMIAGNTRQVLTPERGDAVEDNARSVTKDDVAVPSATAQAARDNELTDGKSSQKTRSITDVPILAENAPLSTADRSTPANTNDPPAPATTRTAVAAVTSKEETYPALPLEMEQRALPPLYTPREIVLTMQVDAQKQVVDPVAAMLARIERREMEVRDAEKEDKKQSHENLWTSIGFAAGSFNSIQQGASPGPSSAMSTANARALAAPIVDQETKASGYSYSMGVNIGTRLSERWVLQGGVNYLTQSSEYTANNVVLTSASYQQRFKPAAINELMHQDAQDLSNKIVYSAPYNVNNSMRYLSIPMQAGYLLVDNTFGLQLNAGIATDLFLQNTIEADADQLDKTSQPSGADSPYRPVNLSGLFGTEFSYRFNKNYRVSLNPGIRYPFNTIYKSELKLEATPLTFDIGLRFRYIFH